MVTINRLFKWIVQNHLDNLFNFIQFFSLAFLQTLYFRGFLKWHVSCIYKSDSKIHPYLPRYHLKMQLDDCLINQVPKHKHGNQLIFAKGEKVWNKQLLSYHVFQNF
jgi:hypothetical protein